MAIAPSSRLASAPQLADVIAAAEPLTPDERRQIVRQAQVLIEQLFVHLPLKRAMHAVDPLQRLRLLERRLPAYDDRRFHDEMISIFVGLRDLHTNYILPRPYAGRVAVLPFRIEAYFEGAARHYIVTGVAPGHPLPAPFAPGVEVTHWNGVPIDLAVARNGDRNAGSNLDARHARGLQSMTQRPMGLLAPPDEDWVDVTYVADGATHQQRFDWVTLEPEGTATGDVPSPLEDPVAGALGIDVLAEELRRAQKLVLAPEAVELELAMAAGGAEAAGDDQLAAVSRFPDVLQFRTVTGPQGPLGYLRIRTFLVRDLAGYLDEVARILALLPQGGLIIDVRGNGGGVIAAGELLLQLLTPREIEPERLHFISTPLTLALTESAGLEAWHESIGESVETGAPFSDGAPLAPQYPELCNLIGQIYHGPVALITDALCYSTTDIFAAGFQDHEIGPIVGTSGNTGAGGANVWDYETLMEALPDAIGPLPKDASMRVAIRRTTRVGERAGDPVEDLGVVPEMVHRMTRRDLLEQNADLIAAAAAALAPLPVRELTVLTVTQDSGVSLHVRTRGLDRIDVYVDGRPVESVDVTDGEAAVLLPHVGAVDVRGHLGGNLVARRKLEVASDG
jgi:hypothetical protein